MRRIFEKLNLVKENLKSQLGIFSKKEKGALNFLEIAIIVVILLVIAYPLYKDIVGNMFTTIKTWFGGILPTIFS